MSNLTSLTKKQVTELMDEFRKEWNWLDDQVSIGSGSPVMINLYRERMEVYGKVMDRIEAMCTLTPTKDYKGDLNEFQYDWVANNYQCERTSEIMTVEEMESYLNAR